MSTVALRAILGGNLKKYLTQEELRALFSVIKSDRDIAMFCLTYKHGLRASEVGLLMKEDVDLKRGRISIRRMKGSESAEYPLFPDTIKLLNRYLESRQDPYPYLFMSREYNPISRHQIGVLYKRYCAQAGIQDGKTHPHCLRHSIAVHMLEGGADIYTIKWHLGHKQISSAMVYLSMTNRKMENELRAVARSGVIVDVR